MTLTEALCRIPFFARLFQQREPLGRYLTIHIWPWLKDGLGINTVDGKKESVTRIAHLMTYALVSFDSA